MWFPVIGSNSLLNRNHFLIVEFCYLTLTTTQIDYWEVSCFQSLPLRKPWLSKVRTHYWYFFLSLVATTQLNHWTKWVLKKLRHRFCFSPKCTSTFAFAWGVGSFSYTSAFVRTACLFSLIKTDTLGVRPCIILSHHGLALCWRKSLEIQISGVYVILLVLVERRLWPRLCNGN